MLNYASYAEHKNAEVRAEAKSDKRKNDRPDRPNLDQMQEQDPDEWEKYLTDFSL